jgi:hypothetical protein
MKIKSHLDFEKTSQILNIKIQQVTSLPTVWAGGLVYLTTDNKVYYGNGSSWIPINSTAGLITGVNGGMGITVSTDGNGVATVTFVPDGATLEGASASAGAAIRIKDGGVTVSKLGDEAVETAKIKDSNVTAAKLATDSVETAKIKGLNVTNEKLATNSVTTIKVTDKNITFAKIQDIPTMTVIGRVAAATGVSSAITILTDLAAVISAHDSLVSAKAVKDYVDSVVGGIGSLEGGFDAATNNNFPTGSGGTKKGDYWYVNVAGSVQGTAFNVGDVLIANKDGASTTLATDWIFLETNRDQATTSTLGLVILASQAEARAMSNTTKALTPSHLGDVKASDAETIAGTTNDRFITPANLSARTATDARTGIVELATDAESIAGSDATRAVTPASVQAKAASNAEAQAGSLTTKFVTPASLASRTATESRTGIAEIATQTEVNAGSDDTRIVTPLKLKTYWDANIGVYGRFVGNIGDGTATSIAVTHSLGTRDVKVEVWDAATYETILCDVVRTSTTVVTLSFASAPTSGQYRVFISK